MGEVKVNYKNVQKYFHLVPSSDIKKGNQEIDKDDYCYLEQKYQLMIKYENMDCAMIKEI